MEQRESGMSRQVYRGEHSSYVACEPLAVALTIDYMACGPDYDRPAKKRTHSRILRADVCRDYKVGSLQRGYVTDGLALRGALFYGEDYFSQ